MEKASTGKPKVRVNVKKFLKVVLTALGILTITFVGLAHIFAWILDKVMSISMGTWATVGIILLAIVICVVTIFTVITHLVNLGKKK